jgi:RND family efflux transporter MFP subunit
MPEVGAHRIPDRTLARRIKKLPRVAVIAACVAFSLVAYGAYARHATYDRLARLAEDQATPSVALISPQRSEGEQELVLPGDLHAWFEAIIHARVSGYVKEWRCDIGARVVAGELLASIDAPELEQQLEQAKGVLAKAEANARLSKLTSKRWAALRASVAVSQQSVDEKAGDVVAKDADTASARANAEKLKALAGFTQIVAPFAGVVTARNVDIGALVGPGDNRELFRVADIHQLRLYVRAPQAFASMLHSGASATIHAPQYADRQFTGHVIATSNAIAQGSRSFLVELLVDNRDEALWPGSYVEAHFLLPVPRGLLRVPAGALARRGGVMQAATIDSDNRVRFKEIVIERDLGSEVIVRSGLSASDRIVATPPGGLDDGDLVQPVVTGGAAAKENNGGAS